MANFFDQFDEKTDAPTGQGNPFDKFDDPANSVPKSAIGYGIGQIKAGVLGDLPEMVGKAMQYTSKPGTNGDIYGQKLRAYGEEQQAANPVDESQGGVTKTVAKGARFVSAYAPAVVGGIAGHFLAPEVAIPADVAIGAGMGGATGGAEGQDTLEKARAAGLSEDQALSLSHKTALVTSVGMFGVNALTAGLGGPLARSVFGTGVKTAEDAVVNAAAPSAIKRFAQDTAVSTLGNEAAMTSTAAANAKIEQDAGLKGPTPGEAAWQAAKDAAAFSLVHAPFGGLHTALAVRDAKVARDQLTNADTDPEIRAQHARQIFANINQVDPEAAQNFANNAQEAIKNQDPLVLDENVIKPSAGASPVAADESQPLSLVPIDQPESATPEQDQRLVPVSKRESPAQATEAAQQPDPRLIPVSERNAQPVDQVEAPAGPLSAAADIGRESGAVQMRTAEQDAAQSPIEGALESAASGDKTAEGGSPDRRQDVATRKTVSEMSSDERAKALLTSDLTGLPNKRAYDEHIQENPDQHTLYGDVDDFKSLNSSYGHNGADQILKAIGDVKSQVAKDMGVNAFHRSGDEFLATHEDPATLESYGKAVQDRLAGLTVEVTNPDGKVSEHTGVGFSYGIGKNDKLAELKSDRQKSERKALGLRTGERDADAVPEQPAGGQQDIKGVLQGPEGTPAEEVKPSAPVDQRLIPVSKRSPAKEAENVTTPIETKQAETQGPQSAADAAVGKEVTRYSSRQTDAEGNPKSGSGMDAFNAKQFAGVLNRAHPELQHVPVERDNGRFDVVGREKAKDSRLVPVSKREVENDTPKEQQAAAGVPAATAGGARSAPVVEVKDIYGRTHRVRQADLDGDADRISTVRKNGEVVPGEEIPRSIIRDAKSKTAAPVEPTTGKPKSSGQRMRDKLEADDPFRSFLAKNGVHPDDKADTGIEAKQRTMVPGHGPIFRKSAPRLDELAAKAHEAGFLSKADIDNDSDNGGTRKLADMIQRSIGNAEVIQRASHEGAKASQSADDQLLQHAHELGIETDGKTADKVYDEVVQHHADDIEAKLDDADIPFDENDPRLKQETLSDDEIDKLFGAPEASGRKTEDARSEDAGGRGAGTGESQDFSRKSEGAGEVNQFSLSSETADQARARIDTEAKRQADEKAAEEKSAQKSKADSEVGGFKLTGSDRAADADPDQNALFSRKRPVFYSQLERSIDAAPAKIDGGSAAQWKLWLDNNAAKLGIKAQEIQWSGITDYLDLMGKQKLSKAQIADYLSQNGVKVREVMKGHPEAPSADGLEERKAVFDKYAEQINPLLDEAGNFRSSPEERLAAREKAERIMADRDREADEAYRLPADETSESKYAQYTLPGGENYRELLLTLPSDADAKSARMDAIEQEIEKSTDEAHKNLLRQEYKRLADDTRGHSYQSSHWDEPNVLAHIRFNDRTDAEGKRVLFIEELQSDWGQEGKKNGFAKPDDAEGLTAAPWKDNPRVWEVSDRNGNFITNVIASDMGLGFDENLTAEMAIKEAQRRLAQEPSRTKSGKNIPQAPFVTDTKAWLSLGIKRMIRYAAENGYDKVAFINGEQSAARYDLSKQISRVQYDDNNSGGIGKPSMEGEPSPGMLRAYDLNGKEVINRHMSPDQVEDHIGKDLAKKIFEQEPKASRESGLSVRRRELSGLDLKVGGEGMKAFYDKIVPQTANEVLKKLGGGKTEPIVVKTGNAPDKVVDQYANQPDHPFTKAQRATVNGFDITPAMRDKAMEGQPLFKRKQIDTNDHLVNAYTDLAKHDAAFNLPHSESKSLKGVLSDISPKATIEDISPHADIGEYSLNDAWKNVEKVSEIKTPGEPKHFALVFETADKKVWVDISQWKPGASGTDIYQAVATYAHNTGKKFVGDPLGLSQEAAYRRTEQMISSALRHGTTEHLEPGKRQMEADATLGDKIKPIDWKQNNDAHNLRELLTSSYYNVRKAVPEIDSVTYNFARGRFETAPDSAARKLVDASVSASDGRSAAKELRADSTADGQSPVRSESGQGSDRSVAGRGTDEVHPERTGDVGNVDAVPFTDADFRRLAESIHGSSGLEQSSERGKAADTIGLRTLKRTVLTGTVLREEGSPGGRAVLDHVSERALQRLSPELKATLYKRDNAFSDSLLSSGTPVEELKSHVSGITEKWENSPKISIVRSASDLPFDAPKDARGAYKSGKVYLVADNIDTPEQAQFVLFHETLGHAGLRGLFGDELNTKLVDLSLKNKNLSEAAAKWRTENEDIRGTRTDAQWRAISIEESLADLAGEGRTINGMDKFLAAVQSGLRAIGLDKVADWMESATNAEVMKALSDARKYIEQGEKEHVFGAREATAFERNSDANKAKFSRAETAPSFYEYGKIKEAAETIAKGLSADEVTRDISRGKFRETLATIDRNTGAVDAALETSRRYFQSIPNEARWKAMEQFQKGGSDNVSDKNARAFFKAWKENSDQRAAKIQGWDEGFLKETIPNYFAQMWKDPKAALEWYQQMLSKRGLEGGKNFLKQRTYASYKEGMSWKVFDKDGGIRFFDTEKEAKAAAGVGETVKPPLEPISSNPTDIMQMSLQQVDKFIAMHEFRQWLNEKGWVKAVKQGATAPDGWAKVDDPAFRSRRAFIIKDKQTGAATDAGIIGHDYMVPALIARDLNNYLAKGLEQYKLWRDFRYVQNFMLSARLGFSAFHAGFTTMDTLVSHVDTGGRYLLDGDVANAVKMWGKALTSPLSAPLEGRKLLQQFYGKAAADPHTAAVLDFLTKGGARAKMNPTDFNNSMHALRQAWDKGDWKGTAFHALPAVMEGVMAPIANHLVPWQKMTARVLLAKFELDHVAEKLGKQKGDYAGITKAMNEDALRQIAYKVVQQVDDRLGQVAYDNLFWNKMAKQVAQASIQSVGWNVGTANVVLGGAKDVNRLFNPEQLLAPLDKAGKVKGNLHRVTGRLSYLIALNLTVGMMGAGLQYAMTGQDPKDLRDIFFPRTGRKNPDGTDERISLPSYIKDEYALTQAPVQTVQHKLHPSLSMVAELLNNQDFYGNQIVNPDDPWTKVAGQVADYLGTAVMPYAVTGLQQNLKKGTSPVLAAAPFIGITPASAAISRTPFEAYVNEKYQSAFHTSKTPESAEKARARSDAINAIKNGEAPDLSQFTKQERLNIYLAARTPMQESLFKRLTLQQKISAYDKATSDEIKKYRLRPIVMRDFAEHGRQMDEDEQAQAKAILNKPL